jgi:deoxyadenosine/deoxycytidine kinase
MNKNEDYYEELTIGIVGPCAAGKSTISNLLKAQGFRKVRHIAQEHSYVPDMWSKISNPDILIYLDVSFQNSLKRRPQNWTVDDYYEQVWRLRNARNNADMYIDTNELTITQVFNLIMKNLQIR